MIRKNTSVRNFCNKFNQGLQRAMYADNIKMIIDDTTLDKSTENLINKIYKKIYGDFKTFKSNINDIKDNPYYKNIKPLKKQIGNLEYTTVRIPARTVLRMNYPKPINEYAEYRTELGYYEEDLVVPILKENGEIWMSITGMEIETAKKAIKKASGNVITFGLGLGYFVYMCSIKDNVDNIVVIEKNPDIIRIFNENILPQFKFKDKITVINGDMYDYLSDNEFMEKFDYKFADVWQSNMDGFEHYKKIINICYSLDNFDFWIEDALLENLVELICVYINCYMNDTVEQLRNTTVTLKRELKQIEKYFEEVDIESGLDIRKLINNKNKLRDILRIKI